MNKLAQPGIIPKLRQILGQEFCVAEQDFPALLFLSIPFGAFFLIFFIVLALPHGISEQEEFLLYTDGWLFAPLLTLFAVWGVNKIRRTFLSDQSELFRVLLLIDSITLLALLSIIHILWLIFKSFYIVSRATAGALILFFIANLIVILFFVLKRENFVLPALFSRIVHHIYTLFPLLMLGVLLNFGAINPYFNDTYTTNRLALLVAVPLGSLSFLHFRIIQDRVSKTFFSIWDILALLIIVLACFDPKFPVDIKHEDFYLGPINNLLMGKTVLVDVFSQYGAFSLVFLAKLFQTGLFPLSYRGLSWIVSILYMIQFALLYAITKALVKSARFAFYTLSLLLIINLFATVNLAQAYPSIGPLRFGLSYFVLGVVILRHHSTGIWSKLALVLECLLVGFISLWSIETFIYTGTMYLGILIYEAFFEGNLQSRGFRWLIQRALAILVSIAFFQALFAINTFFRAGTFPDWGSYFDLILTYSAYAFGTLPIDAWSPWILLVGVYFASLMFFILSFVFWKPVQASIADKLALGLTFLGVAQFTYYVGRSHPNNLLHACVPALMLGAYWVARAKSRSDVPLFLIGFQKMGLYCLYSIAILLFVTNFPGFQHKYSDTGFFYLQTLAKTVVKGGAVSSIFDQTGRYLYDRTPASQRSAEAIEMIRKYWPNQPRVAAFITPDAETEALIRTSKAHLFPIGHPTQDDLSKKISQQILDLSKTMQPGDKILLLAAPDQTLVKMQVDVIQSLCERFEFKELERTPHGIAVFQLEPYQGAAASYCINLQTQ